MALFRVYELEWNCIAAKSDAHCCEHAHLLQRCNLLLQPSLLSRCRLIYVRKAAFERSDLLPLLPYLPPDPKLHS